MSKVIFEEKPKSSQMSREQRMNHKLKYFGLETEKNQHERQMI